ncbi:MAG: hypothetical protein ACYDEN_07845, partial [Acidimicrobiales bacterium]
LGEAGRGRRWAPTAAWFVGGAVAGGATLGAVMAGLALAAGSVSGAAVGAGVGVSGAAGWLAAVGAATCGAALLVELGLAGRRLRPPFLRRQVNEVWLDRFRPWVYGAGFGWQIGFGLATYVMTGAVATMVVLAALSTSPGGALAVGVAFGAARGATVLVGVGVRSPGDLQRVQRVMDRLELPVRVAVVAVLAAAGVGLVGRAGGRARSPAALAAGWLPVGVLVAAAAAIVVATAARRPPRRRPAGVAGYHGAAGGAQERGLTVESTPALSHDDPTNALIRR